jgi:hypothetical protein
VAILGAADGNRIPAPGRKILSCDHGAIEREEP